MNWPLCVDVVWVCPVTLVSSPPKRLSSPPPLYDIRKNEYRLQTASLGFPSDSPVAVGRARRGKCGRALLGVMICSLVSLEAESLVVIKSSESGD